MKLGGSLDHMYTKAQNSLAPTLKYPHGIRHRKTILSPVWPNASGSLQAYSKLALNLFQTYSKLITNLLQTHSKGTPNLLQTNSKLCPSLVQT